MSVTWERNVTQVTWTSATAPGVTWTTVVSTGGGGGGGTFDGEHNDLDGRDADDAHPIDAVTGLRTELDLAANQGHVTATGTTATAIDSLLSGLTTLGAFTGSLVGPTMTLTPPGGTTAGRAQWAHPAALPVGLGSGCDGLYGARLSILSDPGDIDGVLFAIVNTSTGEIVTGNGVTPSDGFLPFDSGALVGLDGKAIVNLQAPISTTPFMLALDSPVLVDAQDPGDLAIVVGLIGSSPVEIHIEWLYGSWTSLAAFEKHRIGYGLEQADDGTIGIKELWRDLPVAIAGGHDGRNAVDALEVVSGWRSDVRRIIADAPTHPLGYSWVQDRVLAARRQLTSANNGVWEILAVGGGGQAPTSAQVGGEPNGTIVAVRCTEWNGHWRDANLLDGTPVVMPDSSLWITVGDGLDCDFTILPGGMMTKSVGAVVYTSGSGPSIDDGDTTIVIYDNDGTEPSLTVTDWDQGSTQTVISAWDGLLFELTSDSEAHLAATQLPPFPTLIVVDGLDGGGTHDAAANRGQLWLWPGYGDELVRLCWGPEPGGGGGGATDLDDLTDVTLTSPSNDDLIQRKAGVFVNRTPAQVKADMSIGTGDVSGLAEFVNDQIGTVVTAGAGVGVTVDDPGNTVTIRSTALALFYGDGSDGDATISGSTTLTGDKYYNNLEVTGTLVTDGYRVFVKGALSGNGTITNAGIAATSNSGASAPHSATIFGAGGAGGSGTTSGGAQPSALTAKMGGSGGAGGSGTSGAGGAAQTGTAMTAITGGTALICDPMAFRSGFGVGSGSGTRMGGGTGGSGGGGNGTNAGGGGGSGGGVVYVSARTITFTGTITAAGGNGANGQASNCGGGGGGGGGCVAVVTASTTQTFTTSVAGGTGGSSGGGSGVAGSNGSAGQARVWLEVA